MIVRRVREVRADKTYTCDILNKIISPDDIHVTVNDTLVVSKEAVRRLPEAFRSTEMLERLLFAIGTPDKGFTPETLHTGIWVFTGGTLYTSEGRKDAKFAFKLRNLKTVEDAMEYIGQRYAALDVFDFDVFENGALVRRTTPEVLVKELALC